MEPSDDLLLNCLAEDANAFPLTSDQKAELDLRLITYEGNRDRGRLAADVLADVRRQVAAKNELERARAQRDTK